MADISHAVLTDPEIHEPKGITTAAAGEVYKADGLGSGIWQASEGVKRVFVTEASDLAGTLDSTVEYFIDGVIDMGSQTITVPAGGLNLSGYNFDISKLVSSEAGYTMFISAGGGSGNLLGKDYGIEVTGTGSQVYNLTSATGFDAFEFARINYNDCTSLGTITGYRQGLEVGTGRFGGSPTLTLAGTWLGGFFIDTSINSRFRSNQNIDLPASAAFFDFAASNFPNASTLQIDGAIVTRNGVSDAADANISPNVAASALSCAWRGNQGMSNTFVGGTDTVSAEAVTTVSATSTFYDIAGIAGTFTPSDLQHFDEPAGGQLRHLGDNPREFRLVGDLAIEGPANDDITVKVVKWDDSASGFVDVFSKTREINNLVGGVNLGFYTLSVGLTLDKDDYVKLQIANESSTGNLTVKDASFFTVLER
jgi:hypothetical protein